MVVVGADRQIRIFTYTGQYLLAEDRMLLDLFVFLFRELSALVQYMVRYTYLSYVMKKCRIIYLLAFLVTLAQKHPELLRILRNSLRMASRVFVLRIDRIYECRCGLLEQSFRRMLSLLERLDLSCLIFTYHPVPAMYHDNNGDDKYITEKSRNARCIIAPQEIDDDHRELSYAQDKSDYIPYPDRIDRRDYKAHSSKR